MAQGAPGASSVVSASLASAATSAVIAVSRYSGVSGSSPIGNVVSGNTLGAGGGCSGGVDTASYSLPFSTSASHSAVFAAAAMRNRTHAPGAGYTERAERAAGAAGDMASTATVDRDVASPASVTIDGTFSGTVDWAVVGVEVRSGGTSSSQFALGVNTVGSGSVALDPPGGLYAPGTVVTLTATADSGGSFLGWSGDLSGTQSPTTITMDASRSVTASFTQLFDLTVNTVGSGSVDVAPPGGSYVSGTVVTLTATPAAGFRFAGWSGDLTGTTSPATLVMGADRTVTATFELPRVVFQQAQTGSSQGSSLVSTSVGLAGGTSQLYLAAVSSIPNSSVTGVSGLGLTWTPLRAQCSGKNGTGVALWMAQGSPVAGGVVTATLASVPNDAVIAVARYAGADLASPIASIVSGNTLGVSGACSGGPDTASYSLPLLVPDANATVFGAAAMRNRNHTPGVGYTERAEVRRGRAKTVASVAVMDRVVAQPSSVAVNGTLTGSADWAVAAVAIRPAPAP
jgi:uncharacterized repeat protein (TIGR02543 family)